MNQVNENEPAIPNEARDSKQYHELKQNQFKTKRDIEPK